MPADLFEDAWKRHLEPYVGTIDAYPAAAYVVRSSREWSRNEASGQAMRMDETLHDMLAAGFAPRIAIIDQGTGTTMARHGIRRLLAHAMAGNLEGVFFHLMERFSRTETQGLLCLILVHRLVGFVRYKAREALVFVNFDAQVKASTILAGREISFSALDGLTNSDNLLRGRVGKLRENHSYSREFGKMIFHHAHRTASTKKRVRPVTSPEDRVQYIIERNILLSSRRTETVRARAWAFNTTAQKYERSMCSRWLDGELVLPRNDWVAKRTTVDSLESGTEEVLPDMVVASRREIHHVRQAFMSLRGKSESKPKAVSLEVMEPFRRAYSDVARHMATAVRRISTSGGADNMPGSDPLYCRAQGCRGFAMVRELSDGSLEAVCLVDSKHRWNPLSGMIIHQATNFTLSHLLCPVCFRPSMTCEKPVDWGENVTVHPMHCGVCGFEVYSTAPLNPALAMERLGFLEPGKNDRTHAAAKIAWLTPRPAEGPDSPSIDYCKLELARIDAILRDMDLSPLQVSGGYANRTARNARRIRARIYEDLMRGFRHPQAYYSHWIAEILGHDAITATSLAQQHLEFFRLNGFANLVEPAGDRRQGAKAYIRGIIEDDLAAGFVRKPKEYIAMLETRYPGYSGNGPKLMVSRILREYREGSYAALFKPLPPTREKEVAHARRLIEADMLHGQRDPISKYGKLIAEHYGLRTSTAVGIAMRAWMQIKRQRGGGKNGSSSR